MCTYSPSLYTKPTQTTQTTNWITQKGVLNIDILAIAYWKCDSTLNPHGCLLVGWSVAWPDCRSVCLSLLPKRAGKLHLCTSTLSYRITWNYKYRPITWKILPKIWKIKLYLKCCVSLNTPCLLPQNNFDKHYTSRACPNRVVILAIKGLEPNSFIAS